MQGAIMALKTILTADEHGALDEAQRDLYEKDEKTDRFVLAVDGIDDHPSIAALRNGHRNSKRERDEAKQKAQDLERRFGKLLTLADDLDLDAAEEDRSEERRVGKGGGSTCRSR